MKKFLAYLVNGTQLTFIGTDYSMHTSEKGQLTTVDILNGEKTIAVISGATFSHLEIEEIPATT